MMKKELTIELFYTGFCLAHESIAIRKGKKKNIRFHANCALIQHPEKGNLLFDTGYSTRFYSATEKWPDKIQALATPATIAESWSVVAQLAEKGIKVEEIEYLIISHYHADHICGLKDFEKSQFYSSKAAFDQINSLNGFAAVRRGLVKNLLPEDLSDRLHYVEGLKKVSRDDHFAYHYDFFGDGSIRIVELPGHARGQIGLILNEGGENHVFLVADGFWLKRSIEKNILPSSLTRLFFDDWKAYKESFEKIRQYGLKYPNCTLISCHCPEVFEACETKIYS